MGDIEYIDLCLLCDESFYSDYLNFTDTKNEMIF